MELRNAMGPLTPFSEQLLQTLSKLLTPHWDGLHCGPGQTPPPSIGFVSMFYHSNRKKLRQENRMVSVPQAYSRDKKTTASHVSRIF